MNWSRSCLSLLSCLTLATAAFAAPSRPGTEGARRGLDATPVVSAQGYRSEAVQDRAQALEEQRAVADWLLSDMSFEALESPLTVELTKSERFALVNPDPNERPYRVGIVKEVGELVDLSHLVPGQKASSRLPFGHVEFRADGGLTWTAAVLSEGASALRLHVTDLDLPPQARLFVHGLFGAAQGPIVSSGPHGDGELWTKNVFGEVAVLQLRVDGPLTNEVLESLRFVLEDVGHSGERFRLAIAQSPAKVHCTSNRECVENAECPTAQSWGPIQNVQDGVAHYQYVSRPFLYICSGGLLADTIGSGRAYFLTANHCIRRDREARTMDTFFQFTVACNGDQVQSCPGPGSPSTHGASVLSTDSESDYTFMELDESPPSGSYFLPWTTAAIASSDDAALHRVSHPSGAPQAYSEHSVDTSAPTCSSWPRGAWIYSRDDYGATEGGSSGAPVTNAAGEVVGQLSGSCGTNVNDECDSLNNATVDGAFANYYPAIEDWLDPTPCSPSPEVCDNGLDDDCDGQADCDDADCLAAPNCDGGSGGCGSGGNGSNCNSDADCSSCNCKRGRCRGN